MPGPFRTRDCQMSTGKVKTQRSSSGCYGITLSDWAPGHSTLELEKMLVTPSLMVNENSVSALGTTFWGLTRTCSWSVICWSLMHHHLSSQVPNKVLFYIVRLPREWAWFWRHSSPLVVPQRALSWSRGQACHLPKWSFGDCLLGCVSVTKAQDGKCPRFCCE